MKTLNRIPADLYKQLYNEIMDYDFNPESEDDCECGMDLQIGNYNIILTATFVVEYVDDSFDHEFGTEYDYHFERGELTGIEIESLILEDDEDDDNDVDLTEVFDYKFFWNQFHTYTTKSRGILIRHGDEVVAIRNRKCGSWKKLIYLYTDTRRGVHICTKSLYGRYRRTIECDIVLPCTETALRIIGKHGYYRYQSV